MSSQLHKARDAMTEATWEYCYEVAAEAARKLDIDSLLRQHLESPQGQETLVLAIEEGISRRSFGPEFSEAAREAVANGVLTDLKQSLLEDLEAGLTARFEKARRDVMASLEWHEQLLQAARRAREEGSWWHWFKGFFKGE